MKKLVFWLEELSAQALLETLTPRLFVNQNTLDQVKLEYHSFQGKTDLQKNIRRKIENYQVPKEHQVAHLVLIDQDAANCRDIKKFLLSQMMTTCPVKIRIACRELETFYLADLKAVSQALELPKILNRQYHQTYRHPDSKSSPSHLLDHLTKSKYQKVIGSREIGKYLDIKNTRSVSFAHLISGIQELLLALGVSALDLV